MLAIEPYLLVDNGDGQFDSHGRLRPDSTHAHDLVSQTLIKIGLTDRLSLYSLPTITEGLGQNHATNGAKFGDLPVELELRFLDPDPRRLIPGLTASLGVNIPTGDVDRLSRAQDGVGTGTWFLRYGLLSQSTYRLVGHDLRLRIWASERQRLSTAGITGLSAYGSDSSFQGHARAGSFGNAGVSLEWGLTRRWVLAMDLYRDWSDGALLYGRDSAGAVRQHASPSGDWSVAPAVEWNFTPTLGAILGVSLPFSGHGEQRTIAPQIAMNCVF